MIASIQLQKAIVSELNQSVYKVTETKMTDPIFPFIEIGDEILLDDNNIKTDKRTFHNITIHTFSKGNDSLESKQLNHYVKESLLNLTVDGFFVDIAKLASLTTQKEYEADGTVFHGILSFEYELTQK